MITVVTDAGVPLDGVRAVVRRWVGGRGRTSESSCSVARYVTDAGKTYYLTKKFAIRDSIESHSAFNSDG